MADSLILATARAYNATLWTQDAHFRAIPGVRFIEKESDFYLLARSLEYQIRKE